jgi:hypothetical protein
MCTYVIPFFGGEVFDDQIKNLRVVGFYPIARVMGIFEAVTSIHYVTLDNLSPVFAHKMAGVLLGAFRQILLVISVRTLIDGGQSQRHYPREKICVVLMLEHDVFQSVS